MTFFGLTKVPLWYYISSLFVKTEGISHLVKICSLGFENVIRVGLRCSSCYLFDDCLPVD